MSTDLHFSRVLPASRDLVWACWTDPALIPLWFMPKPHRALSAEIDLRPGGIFCVEMEVEGTVMKEPGVVLEAIPAQRFVFTDTYAPGWKPNPEPFMTAIIGSLGVDGTLVTRICFVSSSKMQTSVNVPPTSTATRTVLIGSS